MLLVPRGQRAGMLPMTCSTQATPPLVEVIAVVMHTCNPTGEVEIRERIRSSKSSLATMGVPSQSKKKKRRKKTRRRKKRKRRKEKRRKKKRRMRRKKRRRRSKTGQKEKL